MARSREWSAILAGILLLGGGEAMDRGFAALQRQTPGASGAAEHAFPPPGGRITAVLREHNPRLGSATAGRIAAAVERCEREQALPARLVLRVMFAESDARPAARSPKGAIGLMQVMPHMFDQLAIPGNVAHIETNVEAGCLLLADNIRRLGENDGISAYFWGSRIRSQDYLRRVRSMSPALDVPLPLASRQ